MDKANKFNIERLKSYINNNFQSPDLNVEFISRLFGISLSYLSRSFKASTGITTAEYISRCRVGRACYYLENTPCSVSCIANLVGFGSADVFIRSFKKYLGVTPGVYKTNYNKPGDDNMTDVKNRLIPYPAHLTDKNSAVCLGDLCSAPYVIRGEADSEAIALITNAFETVAFSAVTGDGYEIFLSVDPEADCLADAKKAEAYYIDITASQALITAADSAGLYYGAVTLSKLLYTEDGKVYLPQYQILDYPYYQKRGHFLECRYGSDFMTLEDWKNAIDYLSLMKINHIIVGLYGCWSRQYDGVFAEYQYIPFKKYPQLNTPRDIKYYSAKKQGFVYEHDVLPTIYKEDYFGQLIAYAKKKHVNVIPLFNSLGHNTLIPRVFPEISAIDENGEYSKTGFCTNNPKTYEVMFNIYDEIIDRYLIPNGVDSFEIGMDEIWPVMGVDKADIHAESSPFCKCGKCRDKSHIELMVEYIIKLCHHLKGRGINNIYIYHDMLFENDYLNEAFANRLKEEGLYENIIIDWWSYVGYDKLFRGDADKVNSVFRSVGKPITGYFHWNMPNQMNENIYAMTETVMKHSFEGMIAYGSFEYCYDYNFNLFAQCTWNPEYELKNRDTLRRYANYAFPADPGSAYNTLVKAQELTNGRNVREDNYLENFFEYYNNCYLNKDNEYPQDYPGKQFRAIRDEEEKYLPYLKENIDKAKEVYDYFDSLISTEKADIWKLIAATWHTLANEFYTVYTSVKAYHLGDIGADELVGRLRTLVDNRDKTIALLEDVRIEANVYTAARDMTVSRQFICDLIASIEADVKAGIKPSADIFNFKDILSDVSGFLR